ncbi:hypothetical protein PNEG_01790 [Pneumocystis murina B123]|uniref:Rho1 guanine nucleotide exchange factor 1 n=1 Tax=Pneumocystis murina (strain B123) TaxID=1069680 RepID=M7NSD8_PNEMU|nr:hypothetical protein PNEG_01790 [Pneumocystis murina B123]EMR10036.1 hypothetical protein PNEG_01790 [Pneumocystis murina B123]
MNDQYLKHSELSDLDHDLSYTNMAISKNDELLIDNYAKEQYMPLEPHFKSQDISKYYERRSYSEQFHMHHSDTNINRHYYTDAEVVSQSQYKVRSNQSSSNIHTLNSKTDTDFDRAQSFTPSLKYYPNSLSLYFQKSFSPEQSFEYADHVSLYHDFNQISEKGAGNTEVCLETCSNKNTNISEEKISDDKVIKRPENNTYLLQPHQPKSSIVMKNVENKDSFRNQAFKSDSWRENIRGVYYNIYPGQRLENVSTNNRMWSLYNALTPTNELSGSDRPKHSSSNVSSITTKTSNSYPAVYPALLSCVAEAFRQRVILGDKLKDGLTYKDAFTGSEAVDVISKIIRTMDRNLALLLGRSLDAQKFIHDVTYDHRLRDSPNEVYQFRECLSSLSNTDINAQLKADKNDLNKSLTSKVLSQGDLGASYDNHLLNTHSALSCIDFTVSKNCRKTFQNDVDDLPNGVFTLLTECYSPTCVRDQLCYSISCPWRFEQQARLNMKPHSALKRAESRYSLSGLDDTEKEQKLWIQSVPREIADSLNEREKKRQEIICEVIYTERDFVKDLEYLRDFWIKPLRCGNLIPEYRKEKFILAVFSNILDIHAVNSRLAEALTKRQQQHNVIYRIGDIFLEFVPRFDPFIRYGANQLHGKYEFEKEKRENPVFSKFVEETERLRESRKLELNGYLTKPTTRLARYPLLLEAVAKSTPDDNSDKADLMKAVKLVKDFLTKVNIESGRAENRFNLMQLSKQLIFKPGEGLDLKLSDENRRLIFKGILKKRSVSSASMDSGSDIQVFLFDHVLLMVKMTKREQYKVHRKPIPLELLIISQSEEPSERSFVAKRTPLLLNTTLKSTPHKNDNSKGYAITFIHLGRRGYMITLYATTSISRKKWAEHIESQQRSLKERSCIFKRQIICEKYFLRGNKVTCVAPFDGGRKLIYGTENGVYVSDRKPHSSVKATPVRVLAINGVTQVDVLEEYSILLVLADKTLYSYPLESLDLNDTTLANKRPRKIVGHANFFRSGLCLGKLLVCVVKSSVLSSTIKILEPIDNVCRGKKQAPFRFLLQGGQDVLRVFKEFYIPTESTSVHFLKHKLCVGSPKGFEVVNLENLETQSLLDPADTSLDFVTRKENIKPIAIYRLNLKFLLCYDEMAFFVDKNGWATKHDWMIIWEGLPTSFALFYPYLLAFEDSFIEIRHVETTALVQVILGHNIRKLHDNYRECLYAYTDDDGVDKIASLDCWESLKIQSRISSLS